MDCILYSTLDSREWAQVKKAVTKFFIGDLLNSKIVTPEQKVIGHVADVQLTHDPEYKVIALIFGTHGLLYRLHVLNPFRVTSRKPPRLKAVSWDAVESFEQGTVRLKPGYQVKDLSS